jgi:anti-anti-sigma factor
VKCYEITKCSDKEREQCFVWSSFRENPEDFENLKCWILKGMYHDEDKGQREKCKKCGYYISMNRETGLVTEYSADAAIISCSGIINYEKTQSIEKVWTTLKNNKKYRVVFDISNVNMIYSCGLGMLVKIHKETLAQHGMLVIVAGRDQLHTIFHSIKLTKVFHFAPDKEAAVQYFAAHAQKKEAEAQAALKAAEAAKAAAEAAAEAAKPKPEPKKFVRCWEYWNNHNPKNATTCDECFTKLSPSNKPCWVVEGLVEGVAFQFINEECVDCEYFEEYGLSHKTAAE